MSASVVLALHTLPQPPAQPAIGPGGCDYPHLSVDRIGPLWVKHHHGNNAFRYFIYQPGNPAPVCGPVVLFLHGWMAYKPSMYMAWIEHMVRKGYVVVWVQYDRNAFSFWNWYAHAEAAWLDALERLCSGGTPVTAERYADGALKTAIIGHSVGAYMAAMFAARAGQRAYRHPRPHALMLLQPGKGPMCSEAFSRIHSATRIVLAVGDAEARFIHNTAVLLWRQLEHVPEQNKAFLLVRSDSWGRPEQIANHFFPNTDGYGDTAAVDARDYYVTFKLSVAALNCTFRATDYAYAFEHGSEEQVGMGCWSDGRDLTPMLSIRSDDDVRRLVSGRWT